MLHQYTHIERGKKKGVVLSVEVVFKIFADALLVFGVCAHEYAQCAKADASNA